MHKLGCYLFTALMLIGCGKGQPDNEERTVFTLNLYAGLSSLDPAFAGDQAATWMTLQLFDGLVAFDKDLRIQPAIAHSWELDSTATVLTFHLRHDVFFHKHPLLGADSTRLVVAKDFVYSFTRLCDPKVASPGLALFNGEVIGVDVFNEGKANEVSGFQAPDDSTFLIHLTKPFSPFLSTLATPMTSVVPHEVADHYGKDFRKHPVGTGPFQFKRWNEGVSLILLKNPDYFESENGVRLPYLDAVKVRFIRNRLTELMELMQGRLDMVNSVDPTLRNEVFLDGGTLKPKYASTFSLLTGPYLNTEFLAFQTDSSLEVLKDHPLRLKKVREALGWAIDRQAIVQYLQKGFGSTAVNGMVPQGMPNYPHTTVSGFGYDPSKSAALLNEAGFPGGKGLPVLHIHSQPSYQALMEMVQKNWEQIGVITQIDNVEGPVLRKMAAEGSINLWRASWIADYPDPQNYLALFYSHNVPPAGANRFRYRNKNADALYEAAITADSASHLFLQMDQQVIEDAVVLPLFYDRMVTLVNKEVSGLEMNAMNQPCLKRVKKPGGIAR
jgi:oligopeptide transport system substrate-binding protein